MELMLWKKQQIAILTSRNPPPKKRNFLFSHSVLIRKEKRWDEGRRHRTSWTVYTVYIWYILP